MVLGPWGRISLMVALVATLPAAGLFGMFMYVIWFPVILIAGLRGIWAKGWVVPGAPTSSIGVALPSSDVSRVDQAEILRKS